VGNPFLDPNRPRSEATTLWFNPAAFVPNAAGQDGNAGRNILEGPGRRNVDIGLFRDFSFTERMRFQFRAEITNAFNLVSLNNPTSTLNSSAVGTIRTARATRECPICGPTAWAVKYRGPVRFGKFPNSVPDSVVEACSACGVGRLVGEPIDYESERYRSLVETDSSPEAYYRAHDVEQLERLDETLSCFLDLVEASKHYRQLKKQWVEFLGEHPDAATDRVEIATA
jgi:hypothetical protein